eukprot:2184894-Ditylum_brightwellii.AAC.1
MQILNTAASLLLASTVVRFSSTCWQWENGPYDCWVEHTSTCVLPIYCASRVPSSKTEGIFDDLYDTR